MDDVELTWRNKDKTLRAVGNTQYNWFSSAEESMSALSVVETIAGVQSSAEHETNLLVAGDGLDALESLSNSHYQADLLSKGIRLLYIDPPFNSGRMFLQYGDILQRPMWLSMLRDRLEAAKPLLAPNASVWVHLDDSEVHRARCVMDEVFGSEAFVTTVVWQKRTTRESRSAFSTNHDSILVYALAGPRTWKSSRNLLLKDESHLKNRDDDPRGPWSDAPFTAPGYRANQHYDILTPSGTTLRPPRGRSWYATEETFKDLLADGRIWFSKAGAGSPRLKLFAHQLRGLVPSSMWDSTDVGTNDEAKRHLLELFPSQDVFETPKPEQLLERIVHIASNPGDLVMDLFAGSGTTAAVAHKMGRRWVAVERSIETVTNFAFPRLSAVVKGTDVGGITTKQGWNGGGSFKVLHIPPRFGKGEYTGTSSLRTSIQRQLYDLDYYNTATNVSQHFA